MELDKCRDFLRENCVGPKQVGLVRTKQLGTWVLKFQEKKVREWLKFASPIRTGRGGYCPLDIRDPRAYLV